MKADELIQAIRKLVKEEVRKVVTEEVNKSMTRLLAEVINNRNSNVEREIVNEEITPGRGIPNKTYVKDSRLNEALNSTIPNIRVRDAQAGYSPPRVSLSDMFDKVDAGEDAITAPMRQEPKIDTSTKLGMLKSIVSRDPVGQQTSVLDHINSTPIASVFKKDFRAMMKKIDEKQKKGSGGGFFAGVIPMTPTLGGYDNH